MAQRRHSEDEKLYFTDHGQYDIMDYDYAHDNGLIPEDYKVWWGYEDEKLFEFAKEKMYGAFPARRTF